MAALRPSRAIRCSVILLLVVAALVVISVFISYYSLNSWSNSILSQFGAIKSSVAEGSRDWVGLDAPPTAIGVSSRGGVSLVFRPPRTAWLEYLSNELVDYNTYVIEVTSGPDGTTARLHHGSD